MTLDEVIQQLRGMAVRGVVGSTDDTGDVQTATLNTHDDVTRSLVEIHQPYGHASLPPDDQPGTIVLSLGGDQGHQVALQLFSAYRFGKLAKGEVAVYDAGGNRLHLKAGGNVDLLAAALLRIVAHAITVSAPGGTIFEDQVTFDKPVVFQDVVTFQKDVTMNANLTVAGVVTGTGRTRGAL